MRLSYLKDYTKSNLKEVIRMTEQKIGRPSLGITKKVSITLTEEEWKRFEVFKKLEHIKTTSEALRGMIRSNIYKEKESQEEEFMFFD